MTARILVDVARIAYGRDPEYAFDQELGFEEVIAELKEQGQMEEVVKPKKPDPKVEPKEATEKGNL
jgi:hypothetical protein